MSRRSSRTRSDLLLVLAGLLLSSTALSLDDESESTLEVLINTFEEGDQRIPLVGSDAAGRAVVIWQSLGQKEPGWTIYSQRLDWNLDPIGAEFQVNAFNTGSQDGQSLAVAADGSFAVAWNGSDPDSTNDVVSLRRFDADGQPLADDQRISENAGGSQILPRLALLPDNDLMVSWEASEPASSFDILSRRADARGVAITDIATLNTVTEGAQRRADLVASPDGKAFAVWQDALQDGSDWGVFLRCLEPDGSGPAEKQVNQFTASQQARPRIARAPDGRLAIVWQDNRGQSSFVYRRIMARLFDADCQPLGPEQQVNQFDDGIQDQPALSADAAGDFIIAWQSFPEDFELQGIYARRLGRNGDLLGDEFKVSVEVEAFQDFPAVTGLANGDYLFVWESAGQDESGFGIYARRFDGPAAASLDVLAGADQSTEINTRYGQDLIIEVRDQWGQPLANEPVWVQSVDGLASVFFANGQTQFELSTDQDGQAAFAMTANSVAGLVRVEVETPSTGLQASVSLMNLGFSDFAAPIPVPTLGAWPALFLALLLAGVVRCRL